MSHSNTAAFHIYYIVRNDWLADGADCEVEPVPTSYGYQQGAFVGSTFYMFGGWDEDTRYATLYEYDIPVNTIRIIVIAVTVAMLAWTVTMAVLILHEKRRRVKVNGK